MQRWYDEFLYWDPKDYDNITELRLPYDTIWLPDTTLYNSWVIFDLWSLVLNWWAFSWCALSFSLLLLWTVRKHAEIKRYTFLLCNLYFHSPTLVGFAPWFAYVSRARYSQFSNGQNNDAAVVSPSITLKLILGVSLKKAQQSIVWKPLLLYVSHSFACIHWLLFYRTHYSLVKQIARHR